MSSHFPQFASCKWSDKIDLYMGSKTVSSSGVICSEGKAVQSNNPDLPFYQTAPFFITVVSAIISLLVSLGFKYYDVFREKKKTTNERNHQLNFYLYQKIVLENYNRAHLYIEDTNKIIKDFSEKLQTISQAAITKFILQAQLKKYEDLYSGFERNVLHQAGLFDRIIYAPRFQIILEKHNTETIRNISNSSVPSHSLLQTQRTINEEFTTSLQLLTKDVFTC